MARCWGDGRDLFPLRELPIGLDPTAMELSATPAPLAAAPAQVLLAIAIAGAASQLGDEWLSPRKLSQDLRWARRVRSWQCALTARIISGGGFHPDSCR